MNGHFRDSALSLDGQFLLAGLSSFIKGLFAEVIGNREIVLDDRSIQQLQGFLGHELVLLLVFSAAEASFTSTAIFISTAST